MSMPDKIPAWITRAVTEPVSAGKRKRFAGIFVVLQLYFACNILSFGFWKSSRSEFEYMVLFFGAWLVGFTLLLILILRINKRLGMARYDPAACLVLSLPFCFGIWLKSLGVDPLLFWNAIWIVPLLFIYFHFGVNHLAQASILMLALCALSFMGHSGIFAEAGPQQKPGLTDPRVITLDRKTSIHVIMFDSLTHSNYSESFLGVENPAADYLSLLDDTMYAGNRGFVEYVPTRRSWSALFELEQGSRNHNAFSGRAQSLLTDLLRSNGYYIQTGFSGSYFGASQGEYVDKYVFEVADLEQSLVCAQYEAFFGFCSELSLSIYNNWFWKLLKRPQRRKWPEVVINMIEQAEQNISAPVFSAFHIYSPVGHTNGDYLTGNPYMFAKYKEFFISQTRHARQLMERFNQLRERHPNSVFIISGDHGPWLSRTETEDRRFIVLDRHAVALALLNASNLCSWSRDWLERQEYLTPSRMLAAALACNGQSRVFTDHFKDNEEFMRYGKTLAGS